MTDIKNLREAMDEMFDFICDLPSGTDGFECDFDAAFKELNEVEDSMKWIPVTERLPEVVSTHKRWKNNYRKSVRVICVCVQKDGKTMVKEGYYEFWNDYPEPIWRIPGTIDSVTHWMPMPEPPKEVE